MLTELRSPARGAPGPVPPQALAGPTAAPEFPLGRLLDGPADYATVFKVVRAAVRQALGLERPGLGLALSDLPPGLGAYWQVTGNLIVVNESLVDMMRRHADSPREANSLVFVILAHEYLHALGYLSESAVRPVTAKVARAVFGADHPATRMASGDLWRMFPFLQYTPPGEGRRFRVVPRFDLESTFSYIR